jgi:hypothetical protein
MAWVYEVPVRPAGFLTRVESEALWTLTNSIWN